MEGISKIGKGIDETLASLLKENNCEKEDIVFKTSEKKKGLFKGEQVEVTIYKKEAIYDSIKKFLTDICNELKLEVNFEVLNRDDHNIIKMYSNNNNILIGHNGNTLKSLENLVRQKIQIDTGIYFQVSLDVENYKDKRASMLERLAKQTARDVVRTKTVAKLDNMNSYERRIVHNILTNFKGVTTCSEGEEPNRHIVISPTKE